MHFPLLMPHTYFQMLSSRFLACLWFMLLGTQASAQEFAKEMFLGHSKQQLRAAYQHSPTFQGWQEVQNGSDTNVYVTNVVRPELVRIYTLRKGEVFQFMVSDHIRNTDFYFQELVSRFGSPTFSSGVAGWNDKMHHTSWAIKLDDEKNMVLISVIALTSYRVYNPNSKEPFIYPLPR